MAGSLDTFLENHPALNRNGSQELTRAIWGGIAQEYDLMREQVKEVTARPAVLENITGDMLDEVVLRFIGVQRITNEDDASRMKLMYAFFRRNGAGSWATPHAIRGSLSYYFPSTSIYILENVIESNLITEGGFEGFTAGIQVAPFGDWVPSGADIEVLGSDSFQGTNCLKGTGTGTVAQTVAVTTGAAILTTAWLGTVDVKMQRASDGYYWNFQTMTWQAAAAALSLANAGELYALRENPVLVELDDSITITYSVSSGGTDFHIDYLSFGPKPAYPFIKVLVSTFGQSGDFLNNWSGTDDPVAGTDYDNATFFGFDYLGGEGGGVPTAYYQTILDYIKTAGVKAVFEFAGRE